MGIVLGAAGGADRSGADYEEAMAVTRRLREQKFGGVRERVAALRTTAADSGRNSNVLAQGLGWGVGLSLGFWLSLILVAREFL